MADYMDSIETQTSVDPGLDSGGPIDAAKLLARGRADCRKPEASVPRLFAARVSSAGDRPALLEGARELSYKQLDAWSDRIALRLSDHGIERGDIVAVHVERSAAGVAAYLGILKAGGVYLPLHPALPADRKERMLNGAGVRLLIGREYESTRQLRIPLEAWPDLDEPAGPRSALPTIELLPEDGAYMLYTSGSTGEPKGILVSHAGIIRLLIEPNYFEPGPHIRMGLAASIAFDISVFEIWGALLHGGALVIVSEEVAARPREFAGLIREQKINTLMLPPALLQLIAEEVPDAFAAVQDLIYAGEPAAPGFIARLLQGSPPARLINGYGLTEISVLSTYHEILECDGRTSVPIGLPISGSQLYVLDENLEPVTDFEQTGELYIGGTGLADGYLHRPDLTAERFLPDPFGAPGGRMYRSGDLVRWSASGHLIYLGRADRQIKLRGLRIEPGEIEICLARHASIKAVAVRAYGDSDKNQQKYIGAWVVLDESSATSGRELREDFPAALRAYAADQLPEYMIPTGVFFIDELPLSPNGKVNYRALEVPAANGNTGAQTVSHNSSAAFIDRPATATEALLVWLFAESLGRASASVRDGFLEQGGDSLAAMKLTGRVRDQFDVNLSLKQIFLANTVRDIAGEIDRLRAAKVDPEPGPPALAAIAKTAKTAREKESNAEHSGDPQAKASYPLSISQRRIWYLEKLGEGAAYHIPLAFNVTFTGAGGKEKKLLEQALGAIIRRHTILRSVFVDTDGRPRQEVLAYTPPVLTEEQVAPDDLLARIRAFIDEPFDLVHRGGLRHRWLRTAENRAVFLIVLHHLVEDGWSVGVLLRELQELYTALAGNRTADLPELKLQYGDFALQQTLAAQDLKNDPRMQQRLARQAARLEGIKPVEINPDRGRPDVLERRGAEIRFQLDTDATAELRRFNQEQGVTMFMTLQALFWVWLYRLTGNETLLTATQSAGRDDADTQGGIGFFADIKILRGDINRRQDFTGIVQQARAETLGLLEHQDIPFAWLVERIQPRRDPSRNPLFNLGYFHQEAAAMNPRLDLPGLDIEPLALPWHTVRMDLELHTYEEDGKLFARCIYSPALYTTEAVNAYLGMFRTLLEGCLKDPTRPIGQQELIGAAEREELLYKRNPERPVYPERSPVALFEEWVSRAPNAPAIFKDEGCISYAELNAAANRLASHLRAENVRPGQTVGVRLARSAELVICWLGILKARAVYLPLDPDAPAERNTTIIANAKPVLIIDDLSELPLASQSASNPASVAALDDPAYIMYTSGSTGAPKGVLVYARGIVQLVFGNAFAELRPGDRGALASHISFDASTYEIWSALLHGAALVVLRREEVLDPKTLARVLRERKVSALLQTPALFNQAIVVEPNIFKTLKHLMVGGDRLDPRAIRIGLQNPPRHLWNLYGPTEGTVVAAAREIKNVPADAEQIPIGRPVNAGRCYILDESLQVVPTGLPGELYIGGDGIAAGYIGDPRRTAERFLPDPWGRPGARMYRTGDRARWNAAGEIEFLGRVDRQIKLRGFRMEPGEIEHCLRGCPGVQAAVVRLYKADGDSLHAHVAGDSRLNEAELRDFVREKLPAYMVPARIFIHDALPVNSTGKIEYDRLVPPDVESQAETQNAGATKDGPTRAATSDPRTRIRDIWADVLQHTAFGDRDHFFEVGGHSLVLVALLSRLRQLDESLELAELFEHSTVDALTRRVGRTSAGAPPAARAAFDLNVQNNASRNPAPVTEAIAIIGMSGRFPGAPDLERFQENLYAGRESISRFTREELSAHVDADLLDRPDYVPAGGVVDDIDAFDADFFGIGARESQLLPAEDRLFLEECFRTLQYAGYDPARTAGHIGLYAGSDPNHLTARRMLESFTTGGIQYPLLTASRGEFMCSRVAFRLNLTGPVLFIQTACSTSLVAIHTAAQALLRGECDMALAGGVSLIAPRMGYLYQEGGIFAPDGHCRAFDEQAAGVVQGSGVGVVLLKPLEAARRDGDTIQAIIRGSAVTNDGSDKIGFTAPSAPAQERLLTDALERAGLGPDDIDYIETHGTGTRLGDMLEVRALRKVYGEDRALTIGSVKTNIGHASAAAGIAGVFKTVFALQQGQIAPTLHFQKRNEDIFGTSKLTVNPTTLAWPRPGVRRAGVSSFGMGGTNAHAILEANDPPPTEPLVEPAEPGGRDAHVFLYSAKSKAALDEFQDELLQHLEANPALTLADASFTLLVGRPLYANRRAIVARDRDQLLNDLRTGTYASHELVVESGGPVAPSTKAAEAKAVQSKAVESNATENSVVFVFPGQGNLRPGLGQELYAREAGFRRTVDECCAILQVDPERFLNENAADDLAQVALFVFEYALARLMIDWGLRPAAVLGHSLGEYVAATVAGVFTLADVLPLLIARERLMRTSMAPGRMLAVFQESEALPLPAGLSVSTAAPGANIICGDPEKIEAYRQELAGRDIDSRLVPGNRAYHSAAVDGMLADFGRAVAQVTLRPPTIPMLSNAGGDFADLADVTTVAYWTRHTREPVRLKENIARLLESESGIFLEVGPGRGIAAFLKRDPNWPGRRVFGVLPRPEEENEHTSFMQWLAQISLHGAPVDWTRVYAGEERRRVKLPAHPLRRTLLPEPTSRTVPVAHSQPTTAAAVPTTGDFPVFNAGMLYPELATAITAGNLRAARQELVARRPDFRAPFAGELAGELTATMKRAAGELKAARFYLEADARQKLNRLSLLVIHEYFARHIDVGAEKAYSREELLRLFGIQPGFERFFDFFLRAMQAAGVLERRGDTFAFLLRDLESSAEYARQITAEMPRATNMIETIRLCASNFDGVLSGKVDPISVLYPEGTENIVYAAMGRDDPAAYFTHYQDELIGAVVARIKQLAALGHRPRILEIGAGEGYLTWPVLEATAGLEIEYDFTDVGVMFLRKAREKVQALQRSGVRFTKYDLNEDPHEQGLRGPYDIILGLNVLHVAANIDRALKRLGGLLETDGMLFAVEATTVTDWQHIVFGMMPGWWDYADDRRESLFLNFEEWERGLTRAGFQNVRILPGDMELRRGVDHALCVAMRGADATDGARTFSDTPARASALAGALYVRGTEGAAELKERLATIAKRMAPGAGPLLLIDSPEVIGDPAFQLEAESPWRYLQPGADESYADLIARGLALHGAGPRPVDEKRPDRVPEVQVVAQDPVGLDPAALDPVAERLAGFWREALYIPRVDAESDFFQLGGDSMVAVHLVTRIRDELGVRIKPADLLDHPRFSRLTELVRERGQLSNAAGENPDQKSAQVATDENVISTLRPDGGGLPLYLVCPLDVTPLCYLPLARELNRPVYAIQDLELEDNLDEIEKIAGAYVEHLRGRQPTGPYLIGGWSLGGVIAYEMVRQLEDAGQRATLLLLDAPLREYGGSAGGKDELTRLVHQFELYSLALELPLTMSPRELYRFVDGSARNVLSGVKGLFQADASIRGGRGIQQVLRRMVYALPLLDVLLLPRSRRRFLSILNYVPRSVDAGTVLVRVERMLADRDRQLSDLRRLTRGELQVLEAAGNHFTFLWPEYASSFGSRLEKILRDLTEDSGTS